MKLKLKLLSFTLQNVKMLYVLIIKHIIKLNYLKANKKLTVKRQLI